MKKIGIGIIAFNRYDKIKNLIKSIKKNKNFDVFNYYILLEKNIYDKDFASEYSCTLVPQKDRITLRIFLDWSSVEVFANNGELVLSALIFPTPFGGGITIFVERGEILIHQLKIHKIRSVWD